MCTCTILLKTRTPELHSGNRETNKSESDASDRWSACALNREHVTIASAAGRRGAGRQSSAIGPEPSSGSRPTSYVSRQPDQPYRVRTHPPLRAVVSVCGRRTSERRSTGPPA